MIGLALWLVSLVITVWFVLFGLGLLFSILSGILNAISFVMKGDGK